MPPRGARHALCRKWQQARTNAQQCYARQQAQPRCAAPVASSVGGRYYAGKNFLPLPRNAMPVPRARAAYAERMRGARRHAATRYR